MSRDDLLAAEYDVYQEGDDTIYETDDEFYAAEDIEVSNAVAANLQSPNFNRPTISTTILNKLQRRVPLLQIAHSPSAPFEGLHFRTSDATGEIGPDATRRPKATGKVEVLRQWTRTASSMTYTAKYRTTTKRNAEDWRSVVVKDITSENAEAVKQVCR